MVPHVSGSLFENSYYRSRGGLLENEKKEKIHHTIKAIYFSVVKNNISQHPEAFVHLLVCHLEN